MYNCSIIIIITIIATILIIGVNLVPIHDGINCIIM
jgi:hypothetical protein